MVIYKMRYPTFNLYDDTYIPTYEEYVEYCQDQEIEPQGEDSKDYLDYVSNYHKDDWDDMKATLVYSNQANEPCLIYGTLSLWDGKRNAYPVRCETLLGAIEKCFGRSIQNMKIDVENGIVNVQAYHHDGTNHFYIQPLSKKGLKATSKWHYGTAACDTHKDYWVKKYNGFLC